MRNQIYAALVGLIASTGANPAMAEFNPSDWVAETLSKTRAPGVTIGVLVDGQVQIASGGLRAARQTAQVTNDDLWHIGSITKSMTGTLIARLAESGEIEWDDTVGEVLASAVKDIHPGFADLTYADLLTHRSGIQGNISGKETKPLVGTLATRDMLVDRISYAQIVLTPEPGERGAFVYSNAAYVVAGAMLQETTGQTWEALMRSHVFEPLGMTTAGFGAPGSPDVIDQPRGHSLFLRRAMIPGPGADNIPALGPAGTVHASVNDMLAYLGAHTRRDTEFLSEESWARLHTPANDTPENGTEYAMGLAVGADGWMGHEGSNTMWFATAVFVPDREIAMFFAANFAGLHRVSAAMQRGALAVLED